MTLRLAVALEGYGWHPLAWRHSPAAPPVTSGRYWAGLAAIAERGFFDFATFDDALTPQRRRRPEIRPDWLAGRLDAVLIAARVAPVTRHIGLVPVATTTHTRPAAVSKAIATLDFASHGRAGWQVRVSSSAHEAALFGHSGVDAPGDLFAHAEDVVDMVRRHWDGGQGDALTPRWAQGQPIVTALAHARRIYEFASRSADIVFITPQDDASLTALLDEIRQIGDRPLQVFADIYVTFTGIRDDRSDAHVFDGSAEELADLIVGWHAAGLDGIRLRPAVTTDDLTVLVEQVVPHLQRHHGFRTEYRDGESLRDRLGLSVADNRDTRARVV